MKMKKTGIFLIIGAFLLVALTGILFNLNGSVIEDKENTNENLDILRNIKNYKQDLRQITCYCGCEHTDLYNCYEEDMLTECGLCMKEYKTYLEMKDSNTIEEISDYIDNKWGKNEKI